jgi:nicotinamidase-related amidase
METAGGAVFAARAFTMPALPPISNSPSLSDESCAAALLLIDVINNFEFEGADQLLRRARPVTRVLTRLIARTRAANIPIIYVNDNFGRWRSDFHAMVRHCCRPGAPGRVLVEALKPEPQDYFVLKPHNSGFYSTALETLLRHLQAETLIVTGFTSDNCLLYTVHDAHLRRFRLFVPEDASTALTKRDHDEAMRVIRRTTKADLRKSQALPLSKLVSRGER